jgi:TetR/AcrR family transcriptional regulator, cholesterol catabolism regulator
MEELDIKDKILRGAEDLFMKYGVRSISMDDIARHLGVSKKTLYQHFADKEELVMLVSKSHLERNSKEFETILETSENSIEELARISTCMKRNLEGVNQTMLFDIQKFHPKAWSVWIEFKHKYIRESVIRNLKKGIEEGFIRPEVDPEIMSILRIELIQLSFNPDIFQREKFKMVEVHGQLFDHFVFGLVTERGRKLYLKCKELNQQSTTVL